MKIRKATASDIKSIIEIAVEQAKRYPYLKVDKHKMVTTARDMISSPKHFVGVVDVEGSVEGVIAAIVGDNLWAQRQNCNIIMWVSRTPGGGRALLREFVKWFTPRRGIKVAGMHPDIELDSRAFNILTRAGFSKSGGAYLIKR